MNRRIGHGIGFVISLLPFILGSAKLTAAADDLMPGQIESKVRQSLVNLYFYGPSDGPSSLLLGTGTGFVVVGLGGRKWIATTAHGFWRRDTKAPPVVSVGYRCGKMKDSTRCSAYLVDDAHDVAMLTPGVPSDLKEIPALDWSTVDPKHNENLMVIGSPSGLVFTDYSGHAKNSPISLLEIARQQKRKVVEFRPWEQDLTFIQHDIRISEGFSGSPIVSLRDGLVVGIQSSTIKNSSDVGFAVHRQHFFDFDWNRPAHDLSKPILAPVQTAFAVTAAPAVPFRVNPVPASLPPQGNPRLPVKVKLAGIEVEAPFIHRGYIDPQATATEVIEKFIDNKKYYSEDVYGEVRKVQLDRLLKRGPMAIISNPLLKIQFLVPKGYRINALQTDSPNGVLVTLHPDRQVAAPYDSPLSIWVTVEPELFTKGRADFLKNIRPGAPPKLKINLSDEETRSPVAFALTRDRLVNASVADVIDPRFTYDYLDLRVQNPADSPDQPLPPIQGNPKSPLYNRVMIDEGLWLRSSYQSAAETSSLCHLVRLSSRDPVAVVVHYQYTKKNALAFNTGKGDLDLIHLEYSIIASSVSLR